MVLNALFLKGAYRIWQRDEDDAEADNYAVERKFFRCRCAIFSCTSVRSWSKRAATLGLGGW